MLIIGKNPVLETLRQSPEEIISIKYSSSVDKKKIAEIISLAEKKKINVERIQKDLFDKLFEPKDKSEGISQGIVAEIKDFVYYDFFKLLDEIKNKDKALLLILDEIKDPHNLGAIIRTASAVNVDGIILTEKNSAKVNHTVYKTSSGTINFVKIVLAGNIYNTIKALKEAGVNITGTTLNAEKSLYDYQFAEKTAIIFGNEEKGMRTMLKKLCDDVIKIPMFGKTESLNVSVSAGVILYEGIRQRLLP